MRFCYRKFYSETHTGRLMALRPDHPILYHYEEGRLRDVDKELQLLTQVKTYKLLWVAFPLFVALVCAFAILKGSAEELRRRGIEGFRANIVEIAPFLHDRVAELRDWNGVKLLTVRESTASSRVDRESTVRVISLFLFSYA